MKKEQKVELANRVADSMKGSEGIIVTDYKGLSFPQIDTIRRGIKSHGGTFSVIKNTILKKALNSNNVSSLDPYLVDSTALVIIPKDFPQIAKEVKNFSKDYANFKVKVGMMDGSFLSASQVLQIAELPPREQLLAQALSVMNAPVQDFVSLLANIQRSLLNVLLALKDKNIKESSNVSI